MRLTVVLLPSSLTGMVPDDLSVGYSAALNPDPGVKQLLQRSEVTMCAMSKFAMLSIVAPVYPSFANLLDLDERLFQSVTS